MTEELHDTIAVDRIGASGLDVEVRAGTAKLAALAARMQIPAVTALSCRFRLSAAPGGLVVAEGHLQARVVRACVLTLDEFETAIEERFRLQFVPAGTESADDDPESDDEIPYTGGAIDIGDAAAEQLALALDPYPRKPDAVLPAAATESDDTPFAALARLQRRS